jgi:VWFA-related protein
LNVILLDALNTNLLNQAYVRIEMVKFLDKLPQGQPVAIFTMGRKLRMIQDFTTDLTELKKVIRTFKTESSHALSSPTGTPEVPMTLQGWADQTVAEFSPGLRAQIQDFAQQSVADQSDIRIQGTMTALSSLARMLAGYPGRKNLFWITESIPFAVFQNMRVDRLEPTPGGVKPVGPQPTPRSNAQARRQYTDQLELISNLLADSQVAVYPVDARGLVGGALFNVANNVSGQGAAGGLVNRIEGRQADELFQAHYNMRDIAEKTGGLAFYNRNDLDVAVRNGMDDGSTYYSIGYYPSNKDWNGQFRKIQLSVSRSGVKLHYRLGYFAVDRTDYDLRHPEQRDIDFNQALNPDYPVSTALQFEVGIVPPNPGETKIKINYALDPHLLSFEEGADGLERAQVDCAARVFTPKNIEKPVRTDATRINASLKLEAYEKISRTYFPCQLTFDLEPGKCFLRLAVRDNRSGLLGTVNAEFTMPDMKAAATPVSQ